MNSPRYNPFADPRLWATLIWTLTLAAGVAWMDWGLRRMDSSAAAQPVLLTPAQPTDADQRRQFRQSIEREPAVATAFWQSPEQQMQQVAGRFPDEAWRELFPEDQAWLPYVLEVRPRDPLSYPARLRGFVTTQRKAAQWGAVIWNPEHLGRLVRARQWLMSTGGVALALVLLSGLALLLTLPWPRKGGRWLWVMQAMLGLLAPSVVWLAGQIAGAGLDPRGLAISGGLGFVLAGLVSPVIRKRIKQPQRLSFMVAEEKNERQDARDRD